MAAANSSVSSTGLAPYYRSYELPWSPSEEMERRFRLILRNLSIVAAVIAIILWFLPTPERTNNTESLPERVVQLVIEPPKPPPPPPPPVVKPEEKLPVAAKPVIAPKPVDPRQKASKSGLLAFQDELADLREKVDVDKFSKAQNKDPGDVSVVQRSLITSKVGGSSGGINTASISSGLAAGSGGLHGISTTQVKDPTLGAGGARGARAGGSGKASRSDEEVALMFDRNQGAIYALYNRALRDNPAEQGKVVLEITIAPSGEVTAARVVSSELKDPEFERKLIARVRLFHFQAKDVATMITTKPIDFFPQ